MNPEADLRLRLEMIRRAAVNDGEKCRRAFELVRFSLGFFKENGLSRPTREWLLGQLRELYEAAARIGKPRARRRRQGRDARGGPF